MLFSERMHQPIGQTVEPLEAGRGVTGQGTLQAWGLGRGQFGATLQHVQLLVHAVYADVYVHIGICCGTNMYMCICICIYIYI